MDAEWNGVLTAVGAFQPGYMRNMSEMAAFYPQGNGAKNMSLLGYHGSISNSDSIVSPVSDSSGNSHLGRDSTVALLSESLPGFNGGHPDNSSAVEWTAAEQHMLQEGLVKFADEPNIMRYIKIAANLPEKTVRDVALRCKWMMGKRRKQDELHRVRKANYRKDKLAESQSISHLPPAIRDGSGYSFSSPQTERNKHACGALSATAKQLLDENRQVLEQIDANLSSKKLQDNFDLFKCSRKYFEEINAILKKMPGGVSLLPELPQLEDFEHTSDSIPPAHMFMYCTPNVVGQQNNQWPLLC